jgi:hypothetical protein
MRITLLFALKLEPTASAFDKLMPRRNSELRGGWAIFIHERAARRQEASGGVIGGGEGVGGGGGR